MLEKVRQTLFSRVMRPIREHLATPGELPQSLHYRNEGEIVGTDITYRAYRAVIKDVTPLSKFHILEGIVDTTEQIPMLPGEYIVVNRGYGNWLKHVRRNEAGQMVENEISDVAIFKLAEGEDQTLYALISPNMIA